MDFFAQQDRALASSRRLVLLYALAVLGVLVTLNLAGFWIWHASRGRGESLEADGLFHAILTAAILLVIAVATAIKQAEIGGDGANVAELLGGRLVSGTPADLAERRLINVVEEMSLASGVPTPRVFVLNAEKQINAFAAGTRPENAVVVVTRGALDALNRDQLQGVIGHEFSHILNGDMRLNLRLIALNFGIMAIGYLGLQVLRFSPDSSSSRRRDEKDNGAGAVVAFAVAMIVIGYVGTFFGKMLQAAVSRQREYLADASAVQFTRNPDGIAGALKRIGGIGSTLNTTSAGEASHLFFAEGVTGFLDRLFATHPPLADRIRAIDPSFDGKMLVAQASDLGEDSGSVAQAFLPVSDAESAQSETDRAENASTQARMSVPLSSSFAARIDPARAAPLVAAISDELRVAVRDPFDARAVALALLLDADDAVRDRQVAAVRFVDAGAAALAEKYRSLASAVGDAARLSIAELALPALRSLSPSQQATFRQLVRTLAAADQVLSPFELALFKLVDNALPDDATVTAEQGVQFASVGSVAPAAGVLLSVLAMAGGTEQARGAFEAGVSRLKAGRALDFDPTYDGAAFARALATLRLATTPVRRRVVDAAAQVVTLDRVVKPSEMELLRAACAAFDVPVPPVVFSPLAPVSGGEG